MDTRINFIIEKAFTFLADRRLWVTIFAFVFIVRGGAEDLNATETLSDQAVNWVLVIYTIAQNLSWTLREPTSRKGVNNVLDDLING